MTGTEKGLRLSFFRRRPNISGIKVVPYLFILPHMLLLFIFVLIPVVWVLVLSFFHWDVFFPPRFIWFNGFIRTLREPLFWKSLGTTAFYVCGHLLFKIPIAIGLALLLNRRIKGRILFRGLIYFPYVVSMVTVALIWQWMFSAEYGVINFLLSGVGGSYTKNILGNPKLAIYPIIALGVWKNAGQTMVIFLAGLQGIPETVYEAARIDGAGPWKTFWYITLPLLKPITLFVLVISTLGSFKVFDQVYIMTNGGPGYATMTIVQYIYREGFERFNLGMGATASCYLFLILLSITIIQMKFFGKEAGYQ